MKLSYKGLSQDEIRTALDNAIARPPRVHELGGGIYYKCYWLKCNEDLKSWNDYCPACGQRILWEER